MNDIKILGIRIKLESLISKRDGMIWKNKIQEFRNESPIYDEEEFIFIANQMNDLLGELRKSE